MSDTVLLQEEYDRVFAQAVELRAENERLLAADRANLSAAMGYIAENDRLRAENLRLTMENWQLKQACGYPIPADKETIDNPFKCGICDARALADHGKG